MISREVYAALRPKLASFLKRHGDGDKIAGLTQLHSLCSMPGEDGTLQSINLARRVSRFLEEAMAAEPKETLQLFQAACKGDPAAWDSINAARIEMVDNFLVPDAELSTAFFRIVPLGPDERPLIHKTTRKETTIVYTAEGGQVRHRQLVADYDESVLDLDMVSTEQFDYKPRNLYLGSSVGEAALATIDAAFDLAFKCDDIAYTLLTNGTTLGTWANTGKKSTRDFVLHSGISSANLPTTNDIVLSDNTGSTKLRASVFEQVLNYCNSWGKAFGADVPGGRLSPTGVVYVPSSETTQLLNSLDITTAPANKVTEAVYENYMSFKYGIDWTLIPNNRLPKGKALFVLNAPVGTIYTKPSMDMSYDSLQDPGQRASCLAKNKAWRTQSKVWTPYILGCHTNRVVRVTYHS
jgi:hypothetical protein